MRSVQYWSDTSTQIHTNHIRPTSHILRPKVSKAVFSMSSFTFTSQSHTEPAPTAKIFAYHDVIWLIMYGPVWMLGIVIVLANIVGFGCAGLVLLFVDLMAIFQQLRASCRCKSVTSVIRAPCRRCPDDTPDGPTVTFQGYAHFGQFGFHRVAFPQPNRLSPHIQISTVDYIASEHLEHLWFDMV